MNYINIETTLPLIDLSSSLLISPPYLSLLYIKIISRLFKRARRTSTLDLRPRIISSRLTSTSSFASSLFASTSIFVDNNNLLEEIKASNRKRRRR